MAAKQSQTTPRISYKKKVVPPRVSGKPYPSGLSVQPKPPSAADIVANIAPCNAVDRLHLNEAINPYNFVPLSEHVFEPDWSAQVSHDHPFEDGYCGNFNIKVKAVTPLLIGGETQTADGTHSRDRKPIQINGRYAIPSTSLLGMVRSVVEIASFGRFARGVEERSLAMRNVDDEDYKAIVVAASVRDDVKTGVEAGWLHRAPTGWEIEPCDFARLDRNDPAFAAAPEDDKAWFSRTLGRFSDSWKRTHPAGIKIFQSDPKGFPGTAVRTGFIQPRIGLKREYVFFVPKGAPVQVDAQSYSRFDDAHSTNSVWRNQRDGSAGEYQSAALNGERIPVFYLLDGTGKLKTFGLAAMFRVMMPTSLHQAIQQPSPEVPNGDPDLAALMFGQHDAADGPLRGRVSFSHAFADGNPKPLTGASPDQAWMQAILSGPKPTFNPAYIKQKAGQAKFNSLMKKNATLTGWKRYPVGGAPNTRAFFRPPNDNEAVRSNLYPLPAGTEFNGQVHVHNLRLVELGALLWALGWGSVEFSQPAGGPDYLHNLGMGKPLGLGQVQVTFVIADLDLKANDGSPCANIACRAIEAFKEKMNEFLTHKGSCAWAATDQIIELLAMADPKTVAGKEGNIGYLHLDQHRELRPTNDRTDRDSGRFIPGRKRRPLARHSKMPPTGGTWGAG